jgi:hypothetical protein
MSRQRHFAHDEKESSMVQHAQAVRAEFVNEFFDPQRVGYDRERYLRALEDPDGQTRSLTDRVQLLGLLDGQPEDVRESLIGWFGLWPQTAADAIVRLLREAVGSDPPRRVLFAYHQTGASGVDVEGAEFPTDPFVVFIRGVHP